MFGNKKELAKKAYLEGEHPKSIASSYKISLNTLNDWIYKGGSKEPPWKRELECKVKNMDIDVNDFDDICNKGLQIILRSIKMMAEEKVLLSDKGIERMLNIVEKLQKMKIKNQKQKSNMLSTPEDVSAYFSEVE
jgi:uncharacterized protein YjcR